jgi:predicted transcriptional regulator
MTIDKPALLVEINEILQKETKSDWWDNLPLEVQESILEGLTDIQNGNVLTHDQVMEEARQKYGI